MGVLELTKTKGTFGLRLIIELSDLQLRIRIIKS